MPSYSRRLRDALVGVSRRQLGIVFVLAAVFSATGARAANITGIVTDASGTRLSSMVVRAYTAAGADALASTTDSNGRYGLGLFPGDYKILAYDQNGVYATSFGTNADSFDNAPVLHVGSADVANYNFTLQVAGSITGSVRAGNSGVSQAVVSVYNLSGTLRGFTSTNSSGDYSIVVPPGQYKVIAYDNTKVYAPDFFRAQSSFATATIVEVAAGAATAPVDFSLSVGGRLTGFVVDRQTGAPATGLLVSAYDLAGNLISSQTMAADKFDIVVKAGTYRLVVADLTHQYAPEFYGGASTFAGSTAVAVSSGSIQSGLRFAVVAAAHAAGRITNGSGQPLPDITVAAYNVDGTQRTTTTTDATGRYQIDVPQGAYKFVAFDNAQVYAPKFFTDALDFLTAREVDLFAPQTATVDFKLDLGGNFTGTTRDAVTGLPVANVLVEAYDSNGIVVTSATTDANGTYRLVVAPAAYRLVASDALLRYVTSFIGADAYEPSNEIAVAGGASAPVDFQMKKGVLFGGSVTDTAHRPVTGVDVAILDPQGNRTATARSKNGQFQAVLLDGTYKLVAVDPQHRYAVSFYNDALTLASATPISIRKDTPPPSVSFVLSPSPRRRAISH